GIGTALYEEMPFDLAGQPLATTLADYLLPGPTEVPEPRLDHMETPSPYTMFGVKGIGEGGAIAPPAAIANAVNDALRPLGVELKQAERSGDELVIGACITHGDIEDGRIPDVTRGAMQRVAGAIAYRAVRNRGTIGGSLSHADPAADWVSALPALGAKVRLRS